MYEIVTDIVTDRVIKVTFVASSVEDPAPSCNLFFLCMMIFKTIAKLVGITTHKGIAAMRRKLNVVLYCCSLPLSVMLIGKHLILLRVGSNANTVLCTKNVIRIENSCFPVS